MKWLSQLPVSQVLTVRIRHSSLTSNGHYVPLLSYIMTAVQSILESYDLEQLKDIAEYGCASGCASEHIYYDETALFYELHEDEINSYAEDCFGDEFLSVFAVDNVGSLINNLVWFFIESIACDYAYRAEAA